MTSMTTRVLCFTVAAFVSLALLISTTGSPSAASSGKDSPIDGCRPASLLNELDGKDRFKLEQLLRKAIGVENSQAILWRVEKDGVEPSHVFGTVHVVDENLRELRPATLAALAQSKTVALEAEELSRPAFRYAMAQVGPLMVTRERPLQFLLAEDEMKIVEKSLWDAGFPKEMALGLRPWVVTLFLTDSPCQRSKAEAGLKSLDLLVADEAKARGLRLVGLETMYEQYETMASLDDTAQAAWLKASIHLHDKVDDMAHTMAELYRFRRIGMVWDLTRELAPHAGLDGNVLDAIRDQLVTKRNARLFARSLPLVESGGAFVAVGALHLAGPDGLVAKLRAAGYSVTAIE